ncbi:MULTISPECIES: TIGR02677 family protein [Thermomonosporaceae]|uniref:TIGR02677 family protein n=1 Tax=Thermomonosporaceae TaxID=2012 RepID=UPI00255AB11B|nr:MULTISPECIES: TIGR02677 family protein [Thermomonosporaceae]MDL4774538.1 TIGR02677 family protein [Actinomadura xylanilytica]
MVEGVLGEPGELERLTAYTYLTVPDRATHLAVMRAFTSTLLADLSAHDVAERAGGGLTVETVAAKLEQLRHWGNLIPSSRPVRAGSIREYHRVRSRYQLSTLGERVQRQADAILAEADAAREVSRELLALVARGLHDLDEQSADLGGIEPRAALERISTLFAQFGQFADSVRDFYAYLGQVIFRYDLDTAEFTGFKELLLDYAETITDDVAHCAPQIKASIGGLWPRLPDLLADIDAADPGLSALARADVQVQRSRGRDLDDWAGLRAWFFDEDGQGSQVDQLRDATLRALQALLANAKRMIASSTGGLSRRRDLLRLARWFDEVDDTTAHDLFTAAFGLYGARHLGLAPDAEQEVPATSSWSDGPAIAVPIALRNRGTRAAKGRTSGPEDYAAQRDRLRREAEEETRRQHAAAAELRAAGPGLAGVRLSAAATRLLLDLLARSLAGAPPRFEEAEAADDDLDLRLRLVRTSGEGGVIHGADGDLALDGLVLRIGALAGASTVEETG